VPASGFEAATEKDAFDKAVIFNLWFASLDVSFSDNMTTGALSNAGLKVMVAVPASDNAVEPTSILEKKRGIFAGIKKPPNHGI
jgi:hypothetical protein